MKKLFVSIFSLILIGLTVNSCQNDETSNSYEKLNNKSALTTLLMRVSHSNAGKITAKDDDNEDESVCFTVTLPVTITTDGNSATITDPADYNAVLEALESVDDDDDSVVFSFPITITLADGSTQTINDTEGLQTALDGCHSEDDDDGDYDEDEDEDIECLNIHYPLNIIFYDAAGAPTSMTFNNDAELFNFLEALEDDDSFIIAYPATITDANGVTVIVHSNGQLEAAIEHADNHCGDGDGDGDDDDNDNDGD